MAVTRSRGRTWSERREAIARSVRDTRSELRKVVWPTRQMTINLTLVVIGISTAFGLALGGVDLVLSEAIRWLTTTLGGAPGI